MSPADVDMMKQDYAIRITKLLLTNNERELNFDQSVLENIPVNSNEPLFLAAEVFRDTLLEVGIDEAVAERTRAAFYALR